MSNQSNELVTITPLITLRVGVPPNAKLVPPNKPCQVDPEVASDLRDRGFLKPEPIDSQCQKASHEVCDDLEVEPCLSPSDRIDAIIDTIDDLSPDDFGKDKKPNVKAIEKMLGEAITAVERDQAWEKYQSLLSS